MDVQEELMLNLDNSEKEMIKIRRDLHQIPNVSFDEEQTADYIKKFYKELNMKITNFGKGYGFVVDIDSGNPGKNLAIRADFDGLAVEEVNDLPFKSKNKGVMHACGHDAHTAYLMVLAENLEKMKSKLTGKIRILHQPAEEVSPGGAKGMIEAGVLDGIDNVIGIHVMSTLETGEIGYHSAEAQTGRSNFTLTFKGKGGHASMPQISNDAIVAGSYFVTEAQTIISRRVGPFDVASLTIGSFDGVGSYNAIKESVTLKGDVRVMKETTREMVRKEVETMVQGIEKTFGVEATLDYDDNYPVLYNNPQLLSEAMNSLRNAKIPQIKKIEDCGPQDPSEDFAYFAKEKPSAFFYIGCDVNDGEVHPHHSPNFMLNEDSLLIAAKAVGTVALNYLNK